MQKGDPEETKMVTVGDSSHPQGWETEACERYPLEAGPRQARWARCLLRSLSLNGPGSKDDRIKQNWELGPTASGADKSWAEARLSREQTRSLPLVPATDGS